MEEKLIELICEKKFLFDKREPLYKNTKIKEKAWSELAEQLGYDVYIVKKRWTTLRDMYIRVLRKMQKSGDETKPKFKYFDRLQFLKDVYKPKKIQIKSDMDYDTSEKLFSDDNTYNMSNFDFYACASSDECMSNDLYASNNAYTLNLKVERNSTPHPEESQAEDVMTEKISKLAGEDVVGEEILKLVHEIRKKNLQTQTPNVSAFALNIDNLIKEANFSILEKLELEIKILNVIQDAVKNQNKYLN